MINITIPSNLFSAVALFRGVKDIRYYLNGVYLETGPLGARLVVTDGHTLCVGRINGWFPVASVIIPDSLVKLVKSGGRNPATVDITFDETREGDALRMVTLTTYGDKMVSVELEGCFPDWRRVVPSTPASGECGQFAHEYLVRCDKAAALMGQGKFGAAIAHNGSSSAHCVISDDVFAVIMPYRKVPELSPPDWLSDTLAPRDTDSEHQSEVPA